MAPCKLSFVTTDFDACWSSRLNRADGDKLKLIVIEDEALIAMELECMLEDLGHEVLGVGGTLDQALLLVDNHAQEADAAVLDANLGGTSAVPVAEAMDARDLPYIVASGYEPEELQRFGLWRDQNGGQTVLTTGTREGAVGAAATLNQPALVRPRGTARRSGGHFFDRTHIIPATAVGGV
jgi:CheY-like chemotaxis protein